MKHWKVVFAIVCGLIVAACGEESAAQKAVRASLKDPDSAKFGKFTSGKDKNGKFYACVTVNAKNSMGGYVGDKQASLFQSNGEWEVLGINNMSHEQCVEFATK